MIILRSINGLLDRIFSVIGAVALSQFPHLIAQYIDVLTGALAEARRNIKVFQEQAALVGMDLPTLIQKHLTNSEPAFRASGEAMRKSLTRLEEYEVAHKALTEAGALTRPFEFFRYLDTVLFEALKFKPGVPLTIEGALYALVGIFVGLILYHISIGLIFRLFKSPA